MSSRSGNTGIQVDLDRSTVQAARALLAAYCEHAEVRYAALLEESGVVCADAGDTAYRDSGETGAICAGAFAAVREVARRLGEQNFEGLTHEGKALHFHLSPVNAVFMMLSVFGNETRIGIVRTCAVQTGTRLREQLAHLAPAAEAEEKEPAAAAPDQPVQAAPVLPPARGDTPVLRSETPEEREAHGDFTLPAELFLAAD